jgi:hypothetical protein
MKVHNFTVFLAFLAQIGRPPNSHTLHLEGAFCWKLGPAFPGTLASGIGSASRSGHRAAGSIILRYDRSLWLVSRSGRPQKGGGWDQTSMRRSHCRPPCCIWKLILQGSFPARPGVEQHQALQGAQNKRVREQSQEPRYLPDRLLKITPIPWISPGWYGKPPPISLSVSGWY